MRRLVPVFLALLLCIPACQESKQAAGNSNHRGGAAITPTQTFGPSELAVGKVAPNITGTDEDGKQFQLSDYRGKVVVLDFWGEW
jgi:cytochrome oxidase Cu insertion factor (SCO1/SenC/PrrC family)